MALFGISKAPREYNCSTYISTIVLFLEMTFKPTMGISLAAEVSFQVIHKVEGKRFGFKMDIQCARSSIGPIPEVL